jgi:HPt (histidine-containing phosphotransfer) domain-containing protein
MNDCIVKPVRRENVYEVIRKGCSGKKPMNFCKLAEEAGFEEGEVVEIVRLFIETGASDLKRLESALHEDSAEGIAEAAHSLKGGAASFGFEEIFESARILEANARRNSLQGAGQGIRKIRDGLDTIAGALRTRS